MLHPRTGRSRLALGLGIAAVLLGGAVAAWLLLAGGETPESASGTAATEQPTPDRPEPGPPVTLDEARAAIARLGDVGGVPQEIAAMTEYRIGYALLGSNAPAAGVALIRDAAEHGFALAAATMGDGYLHGTFGLPKDHGQAMTWYDRALSAGNPVAAFEVATIHFNGIDVPADPKRAAPLFRQAYFNNYPTAVELVAKARAGDAEAAGILARMGLDPGSIGGTIGDIYRERTTLGAAATRQRLAQLVSEQQPLALFFLARMLESEDGGARQSEDAAKLYLESARAGWWAANVHYARLVMQGALGEPNYLAAALCLRLASAFPFRFEDPALDPAELRREAEAKLTRDQATALDDVARMIGPAPLPVAAGAGANGTADGPDAAPATR